MCRALFYYVQAKLGFVLRMLCQKRVANTDMKAEHAEMQLWITDRHISYLFHGDELLRHILGRLKQWINPFLGPLVKKRTYSVTCERNNIYIYITLNEEQKNNLHVPGRLARRKYSSLVLYRAMIEKFQHKKFMPSSVSRSVDQSHPTRNLLKFLLLLSFYLLSYDWKAILKHYLL